MSFMSNALQNWICPRSSTDNPPSNNLTSSFMISDPFFFTLVSRLLAPQLVSVLNMPELQTFKKSDRPAVLRADIGQKPFHARMPLHEELHRLLPATFSPVFLKN